MNVKGSLLVNLRTFVAQESAAPGAWDALLAKVPSSDRTVLSGIILVGGWYPVGVWNRALDTYLPSNFKDPDAGMAKLASFVAERDLPTLFRLVLKIGTPDFVMSRTPSLYNRYFDAGSFTPSKVEANHWHAALAVDRDVEAGPGLFSCDAGITAWLTQALQLTGVNARVHHSACRFRMNRQCEYELRW